MTSSAAEADWLAANQLFLTAALAVIGRRVAGASVGADVEAEAELRRRDEVRRAMPAPPALEAVASRFGLSGFERDLLLLCAGVELDAAVARACAAAHGDPDRPYATFSLAMTALPDAHWSALTPAAALRRWQLVELTRPDTPTTSPLRVDERILHALTGIAYLDPRIQAIARPVPPGVLPAGSLPPSLAGAAAKLGSFWSAAATRRVRLVGRQRADLRAIVAYASAEAGLHPTALRAADLPTTATERDLLARLCARETALAGRSWLVEVDDDGPEASRNAIEFAARLPAPTVLASRVGLGGPDCGLPEIEVGPGSAGERRAMLVRALGPAVADALPDWVDRIAGQFDLGLAGLAAVVQEIPELTGDPATGRTSNPALDSRIGPRLWDACRRQARPAMADLAQRIEPRAGWDSLVLPAPQRRTLRELVRHVRHGLTVLEEWGFAGRCAGGLGVTALFAGASGTGKTLAAEVVAADLRLDLYRVDLSQVVSKYIGETEKNLRRIFDAAEAGGAVLLFDEADALFGKRSEVRDSHDRYANIEVSYLLQRMEAYRGLAILTTNLRSALDPAFLRRLRFIVPFPLPDLAGRTEIWRRIFPAATPTEGLDPAKLARLNVTGGTIRNVALSAAFLAADAAEPVRMAHLLAAARAEYAKLEKPLTDAEVLRWTD